jgi:hypothetical protein
MKSNHTTPFALALFAAVSMVVGNVGAQDFSGILTGLNGGTAVTAIVAAAAILALVGFAKWGAKKVASFFG